MAYQITELCTGCTACTKICPTSAITGTRNQRHIIAQARCIDCGVCGKVCPPGAIRDARGNAASLLKKSLWPKPVVNITVCTACGICVQSCPVTCLALSEPANGDPNAYPALHEPKRCLACAFCADDCPVGAIIMQVPN